MAFIDHHERIVLFREVTDLVNLRYIPVHREHPVGHDDLEAVIGRLGFLQLCFQIRHVVIGVPVARRFAQAHPVDDAGVVQRIGNDGIVRAEQRLEYPAVRIECCGV